LKRFTPGVADNGHRVFVDELEEAGACQQNGQINWLEAFATDTDSDRRTRSFNIRTADDAREKLRARQFQDANEVKIWSHTNGSARKLRPHPLSNFMALEQDFTTPGTPSKLGCPFATPGGQRSIGTPRSSISRLSARGSGMRSKRASFHDPIRAEICGIDPLSPAPTASVAGESAGACPIRFLDQHSPEEVAEYFEKHKHEIPRSHEVCIKRYQSNEQSIRQLDAKYGSLVSMIQGLGAKHQPMLPEKGEGEDDEDEAIEDIQDEPDSKHRDKVRKWATNVTNSLRNSSEEVNVDPTAGDTLDDPPDPDERVPHFDRPLKDVRVGESPSRPWGIQVPVKYQKAASAPSSEASAPASSPRKETIEVPKPMSERLARPVGLMEGKSGAKCPFDHGQFRKANEQDNKQKLQPQGVEAQVEKPKPPVPAQPMVIAAEPSKGGDSPQMVFNGPVFIGYSVEQAMTIINGTRFGK